MKEERELSRGMAESVIERIESEEQRKKEEGEERGICFVFSPTATRERERRERS